MAQTIKILRSSSTALVEGVSTLAFGILAETNIGGVSRLYIGDTNNLAVEIAGEAYARLDSPALTGTPTTPTAITGTNTTQIASTAFVNAAISASIAGALIFRGFIDCSTNPNYPAAVVGDVYKVSVAGKIGGASGEVVKVGDTIYCTNTNAGGDQATVGGDFEILQYNLDVEAMAGNGLSASGDTLNVNVDDSSIEINSDALRVKNDGITASKINSSAIGNGLTGGSGSSIQALSDNTGGANLSRSVNVSANGLAVKIDSTSIIENGSQQLSVGTVDCGTF